MRNRKRNNTRYAAIGIFALLVSFLPSCASVMGAQARMAGLSNTSFEQLGGNVQLPAFGMQDGGSWSWLAVLFTLAIVAWGIGMFIAIRKNKRQSAPAVVALVVAALSIAVLLLSQDFSGSAVAVNSKTILSASLLLDQGVNHLLCRQYENRRRMDAEF